MPSGGCTGRVSLPPKGAAVSWMRRAGAVVLAVALVVLIPVPAEAAGWKRPVDPYPDLPSAQFQTWVQTSNGPVTVGGYQPGSTGWAEEQAAARAYLSSKGYAPPSTVSAAKVAAVRDGVADISSLPRQLTAPTAITRGAAGGTLVGAFAAGWSITDGTLALYGAVDPNSSNPLQSTCGWGPVGSNVVALLYPLSAPDCRVSIGTPEAGQTISGGFAEAGPLRVAYVGAITADYGGNQGVRTSHCFKITLVGDASGWSTQIVDEPKPRVPAWSCVGLAGSRNLSPGYMAPAPMPPRVQIWQGQTLRATTSAVSFMSKADAPRSVGCQISWSNGATTSGSGGSYSESGGFSLGAYQAGCASAYAAGPAGAKPTRIKTSSTLPDGSETTLQDTTVADGAAPATGDGSGLRLFKRAAGGALVSCMTWEADCAGWWQASSQGQSDTDYACTYGGAAVALSECYVYEKTFEDQTATKDSTITDPATGDQTKWSSNSDALSTDPSTGPSPADECWDSWSSAPNPIEWVFHPVQCALVWAFAPRQAKLKEFQDRVDRSWRGSTPGKFAASIAGVGVAFDALGPGNCRGVILPVPKVQQGSFLPAIENRPVLQACPGDFFEPFAPVFFWLITISIGVGGFFIIKRQLDRLVNN